MTHNFRISSIKFLLIAVILSWVFLIVVTFMYIRIQVTNFFYNSLNRKKIQLWRNMWSSYNINVVKVWYNFWSYHCIRKAYTTYKAPARNIVKLWIKVRIESDQLANYVCSFVALKTACSTKTTFHINWAHHSIYISNGNLNRHNTQTCSHWLRHTLWKYQSNLFLHTH